MPSSTCRLTIKNYRCFSDQSPARIDIAPGFTALVGPNNSGKSTLLRLFYELRQLFAVVSDPAQLRDALRGRARPFNLTDVVDTSQLFHNSNRRDLEIQMEFSDAPAVANATAPTRLIVRVARDTNTFTASLYTGAADIADNAGALGWEDPVITNPRLGLRIDLTAVREWCQRLASTLFIGPFRNAINIGANDSYFDIQTGDAFIRTWRSWKSGPQVMMNDTTYQLTRDIASLFGFTTLEINPSHDDKTLQIFVNGKSALLQNL